MDHVCEPLRNSPAGIPVRTSVRARAKVAEVVLPEPIVVPEGVVEIPVVEMR